MQSRSSSSYAVVWTNESTSNLNEIYDYGPVARKEPANANKLIKSLVAFGNQLGTNPFAYTATKPLPSKQTKYYKAVFKKNYLLIFRPQASSHRLYIVTILHAARKPNNRYV